MKKTIRRAMRTKNLSVDKMARENYANEVFTAIENLKIFESSTTIALFASLDDELPTNNIIAKWCGTKKILLPRVGKNFEMEFYEYNPSDIASGAFGIEEPQGIDAIAPSEIDLIIVPGVAFSLSGKRIGRGKGFYDRYLSREGIRAYTIGVCYPHQILSEIPTEEHDFVMNEVISAAF